MNGSPSSIVMLGLGNGTFAGSPSLMVTLGYGIAAASTLVIGRWSNPIQIISSNQRIDVMSSNTRIDVTCQQ